MANPLQISVDDTSPSVSYFPFADTFGTPDVSAGWNPYYTGSSFAAFQGQEGEGNSLHRTSLDGASFSVQWIGVYHSFFDRSSRTNLESWHQALASKSSAMPLEHIAT